MSKVSFLFRTDVHTSATSPASWKGDYPSEVFSCLEQVGELARALGVTAVLDGGDFIDKKSPIKTPHSLIKRTILVHRQYPCKTYTIPGNHDLTGNNLESLDKQPLGVLLSSGTFQILDDVVFEDGPIKVRVVGVPYDPKLSLETLRGIQKQPGDTHLIAVVHALATKDPPPSVEDFFGEPVFKYADLVTSNGPDAFLFGHWHKDQGVTQIDNIYFVNQGSLSRGALVKENLERIPKVAHIEIDELGLHISTIEMKVLPASEVFDLEKKEKTEKKQENLTQFIQMLVTQSNFDPSKGIMENIRSLDFAESVVSRSKRYLEEFGVS